MRPALITGANGFAASHLAEYLSGFKEPVVGTVRAGSNRCSKNFSKLYPLDVRDFNQVLRVIQTVKPRVLYHLAAFSVPRLSWSKKEETISVNVMGTLNILEALRRTRCKTRLIFASTSLVYGDAFLCGKPVNEQTTLYPINPYAGSKILTEFECLNYVSSFGLDVVIARPFNHLGVGQNPRLVFSDWTRQIALSEAGKREPVLYTGNLDVWREFLHVKDVVRAYELLSRRGKTGEAYNICTGKVSLLEDTVTYLLSRARVKMTQKTEKARLRTDDPPRIQGDGKRLSRLGWKPRLSAFQALDDLIAYYRRTV